jgi:hypothetical protein
MIVILSIILIVSIVIEVIERIVFMILFVNRDDFIGTNFSGFFIIFNTLFLYQTLSKEFNL